MKYLISLFSVFFIFLLSSCSDADVASRNLSRDADYFNINRRIVFYNGLEMVRVFLLRRPFRFEEKLVLFSPTICIRLYMSEGGR